MLWNMYLASTLTDRQQEILNESGNSDLMRNSNSIINCAMLLSLGYISEATTYAESCGGGGSPCSGWGRDKDEDNDHWWRRCIAVSAAMMRPAKYGCDVDVENDEPKCSMSIFLLNIWVQS